MTDGAIGPMDVTTLILEVRILTDRISQILPVIVGNGKPALSVRLALMEDHIEELKIESKNRAAHRHAEEIRQATAEEENRQRLKSQRWSLRLAIITAILSPIGTILIGWLVLRNHGSIP